MDQKRRDIDVEMRIAFLHQAHVFYAYLHLMVDNLVFISFQRSALGIEKKQSQFGPKILDERKHGKDVVYLPLPHIEHFYGQVLLIVVREDISVDCREQRTHHRTKQHILALEIMVQSEEHTSELQSRQYLVCRLLLEKK